MPKALDVRHLEELQRFAQLWEASPRRETAVDLLGAAVVAGRHDLTVSPASYLVEVATDGPIGLMATRALATRDSPDVTDDRERELDPDTLEPDQIREWIGRQKDRLADDPRNALAWASLARRYVALGQNWKADYALTIATSLAPRSRYILRVFTRFCVHIGEPQRAIRLLEDSGRVQSDPLIHAAYLSAIGAGSARVPSLRPARQLLDNDAFKPIERSDLASEVGTLELAAGADRRTRKLFERSLASPTDNSLAQAEWASHRVLSLEVPLAQTKVPFAAEAQAQAAFQQGDWESALLNAKTWQQDQPFDTSAAFLGTIVALVGLERWHDGLEFCRVGLRTHPGHPMLLNDLAYALIELGQLEEATKALDEVGEPTGTEPTDIAVRATRGLLAFRRGDVEEGRRRYLDAVSASQTASNRDYEAMALAMLLREECRLAAPDRIKMLAASIAAVSPYVSNLAVRTCVTRALGLADAALSDK
ncbi:MAG: hypothetical protein K9G24_10140 [Candidatus Nanopelagicales bacterium]|nr:hypothetical protein [Candidatus Nanopelagicales bacterium]MCF8543427.1 hypothetical protein [Candidatus Nanopelagicales bacterium]MCF8558241.1 hypothetical protein [Candidatus Nanopelagicales bacterium]